MKTAMKTKKISQGHYETEYKGHKIELINLSLMGGANEWIAPIDGANDLAPVCTKKQALRMAINEIDS